MQKPDLSYHFLYLATCNRNKRALLPRQLWIAGDDIEIWVMEDPALYRWRGLVPKVTANRLTKDIDYKLDNSQFTLMVGDPGQDYTLILLNK